jgi:hypothetical protein
MVLTDLEFKSKEDYWKDSKVQKQFSNSYGSEAKMRFDQAYDNSKKEFANFQLGQYQRSQTGHELIREDMSALRMDVTTRFSNMAGTLKTGMTGLHLQKITEKMQLKLKR